MKATPFDVYRDGAVVTANRGTVLAVRREWVDRAVEVSWAELFKARAVAVELRFESFALALVSVHVDLRVPMPAKRVALAKIRRCLDARERAFALMLGDWNLVPSDETRLPGSGQTMVPNGPVGEAFEVQFSDFAEVHQPDCTWGRRDSAGHPTLTRIDRAYAKVDHLDAQKLAWTSAARGGGCLDARHRASDHLPVSVASRERRAAQASRPLARAFLLALP